LGGTENQQGGTVCESPVWGCHCENSCGRQSAESTIQGGLARVISASEQKMSPLSFPSLAYHSVVATGRKGWGWQRVGPQLRYLMQSLVRVGWRGGERRMMRDAKGSWVKENKARELGGEGGGRTLGGRGWYAGRAASTAAGAGRHSKEHFAIPGKSRLDTQPSLTWCLPTVLYRSGSQHCSVFLPPVSIHR